MVAIPLGVLAIVMTASVATPDNSGQTGTGFRDAKPGLLQNGGLPEPVSRQETTLWQ
jgi:hypothetical protein